MSRSVLHVDLQHDPAPITIGDEHRLVVIWWGAVPLGHIALPTNGGTRSWADLRIADILPAISPSVSHYGAGLPGSMQEPIEAFHRSDDRALSTRRLSALRALLDAHAGLAPRPSTDAMPSVSIIVPTRNRPSSLERCLTSLTHLRGCPLEILVVDNAPSAATRTIVDAQPAVRYIEEPYRGSSAARNTGVRHSRGAVVAFVDDDETVHPNWLCCLRACFTDGDVAAATGLVLPDELRSPAQQLFEQRFGFARGYVPRTFTPDFLNGPSWRSRPVWHIGGSGNLAVRRSAFERLGGFDERLGAGRAGCSEDTEFFYRLLSSGNTIRYEPRSVIYHTHRSTAADVQQQAFLYMRGHTTALLLQFAHSGDWGNLTRLFWELPTYYVRQSVRASLTQAPLANRLLHSEVAGMLAGLRYYHQCRHAPARRTNCDRVNGGPSASVDPPTTSFRFPPSKT